MNNRTDSPLPRLPKRPATSHKGDFGRALLVGGSLGMSGAIVLAGRAALRSGAGTVTLAIPKSIQSTVAASEPSYMTIGLVETRDGHISAGAANELESAIARATVIAIGPGIGRNTGAVELVHSLYSELNCPLVVDADGLSALSESIGHLSAGSGSRILTPHAAEFARLARRPALPADDIDGRASAAAALAAADPSGQTIVLLKGSPTVIADRDSFALNSTGNPGMATGGSGDVLTGIVAALLCQGLSPFDAARLAAHVHGRAGDLAAIEIGEVALISSDLMRFLPSAWQQTAQAEGAR